MPTPPLNDEFLRETVTLLQKYGTVAEFSRATGIAQSTIKHRLKLASRRGIAPGHFEHGVAPGYAMGKVTVQRNANGVVERTWERQSPEAENFLTLIRETVEALSEVLLRAESVSPPEFNPNDLLNLFTFTDYHLGMQAWRDEGGADWDLPIAEGLLLNAMIAMVKQSPDAHTAVINIQGDFLHTDGKVPVTPAHKHVLDASARYPSIRRSAIRLIRKLVLLALESHAHVHVIIAEGNHDEEGTGWLADLFSVHYENEPRVTVDCNPLPFYVFEWGDTMLGVHHGHKVKNEQLPLLFAAQFPQQWGRTNRREIHCGHRHHRDEKEYNGVTVIQHPTLSARDAYAARGGWIADRAAQSITYHKKFGQVGRVMICPEMLR